jgi:DNA modification methylase
MTDTVHLGDCLELMKNIPNGSIDMILCDLPYGTTRNKWDVVIPLSSLWSEYNRIIKANGAVVLTGAQPFTSVLVVSNIKMFRYDITWEKSNATGFMNSKKMPLRAHEDILVFYKKLPVYNPQKTKAETSSLRSHKNDRFSSNYGKQIVAAYGGDDFNRFPRSVIKIGKEKGFSSATNNTRIHPTQKPEELFEWLIRTYSNEGDTVLDNCAGSGTTAIACINTNRRYILIEKDPIYYKAILNRINKHLFP